jgi:hypothetical protein
MIPPAMTPDHKSTEQLRQADGAGWITTLKGASTRVRRQCIGGPSCAFA